MAENVTKTDTSAALERLCAMIKAGKPNSEILKEFEGSSLAVGMEPVGAGIIRTNKGALMVRVSDNRWPIAMYKKDWRILLSKIDAIKDALETLDILEENPTPTNKQQANAAEAAVAEERKAA